jgi:hypothetical protein
LPLAAGASALQLLRERRHTQERTFARLLVRTESRATMHDCNHRARLLIRWTEQMRNQCGGEIEKSTCGSSIGTCGAGFLLILCTSTDDFRSAGNASTIMPNSAAQTTIRKRAFKD